MTRGGSGTAWTAPRFAAGKGGWVAIAWCAGRGRVEERRRGRGGKERERARGEGWRRPEVGESGGRGSGYFPVKLFCLYKYQFSLPMLNFRITTKGPVRAPRIYLYHMSE